MFFFPSYHCIFSYSTKQIMIFYFYLMQIFQTISYSCTSKPDGFCIIQIHCSSWEGHDSGSNIWIICTCHPFCYEWFCPIKRYHESKTNKQSHRLSHYVPSYKISLFFAYAHRQNKKMVDMGILDITYDVWTKRHGK